MTGISSLVMKPSLLFSIIWCVPCSQRNLLITTGDNIVSGGDRQTSPWCSGKATRLVNQGPLINQGPWVRSLGFSFG